MPRLRRMLLAVTSAALIASALPASAAVHAKPGSPGIGDPYFPTYGNGGYQVLRYDIHAGYANRSEMLRGRTTVVARATESLSRFNLDLLLHASAVRVNGRPARFRQHRHELIVLPKHSIAKGSRMRVHVTYAGKPGGIRYGGERPFKAGHHGALAVGQPNIAAWWFPSNDHPRDKARFRITLRGAKGQQTISNGSLLGKHTLHGHTTWRWRSRAPMATYLAFAAWGDYAIDRGRAPSGRRYLFAYDRRLSSGVRHNAQRSLRASDRITSFLAKRWGHYPFGQIGGVVTASPLGYALENQTRPVYDDAFFGGTNKTVVAHELAHQWFGDAVALRNWRGIWLNEGYATYSEWLWSAHHSGPSLREHFHRVMSAPASDPYWDLPLRNPGQRRIFADQTYSRGAATLYALRHKVGTRKFYALSRRWVHHNNGVGNQREFRRLAERISGKELGPFFRSWLGTGKPEV